MIVNSIINETVQTSNKKTSKKPKKTGSVFLVTINTNKSYHCEDECVKKLMPELEVYFKALAENLFSDKNIPKLLVQSRKEKVLVNGKNEWIRKPVNLDLVDSIEAKTNIEANMDGKAFLHLHSYIRVKHRTHLLLDLTKITDITYKILKKPLTINGKFYRPRVRIDAVPDNSTRLEDYVKGDV
jgi:hypothetical protein